MTQILDKRQDPLNLGGGWASSAPLRSWSSCHRRRRGAPINKRWHRYGPKAEYEPPRKQQRGPDPWFQPPRRPYWAMSSNSGHWGGPWHPPPARFWKVPSQVQMIRLCGLQPFCLCCCSCWRRHWNPGWIRPYGRKRRWGRRGRGLRRHPRRFPRSPPVDLSMLLRPVNLYGWRAPGMRAPRNTTQFIMNQIYEDMRQQEKLERQQEALRTQEVQAGEPASPAATSGDYAPPSGAEEDAELQEILYSFVQDPCLVFSPVTKEENQSPTPQIMEEAEQKNDEEEGYEEEVCDEQSEGEDEEADGEEGEDEEEGADGEEEGEEGEEAEEADYEQEMGEEDEDEQIAEEEEGMYDQSEEDNHLPLEMPLSILVESEEERENFINYDYFSPDQINPGVSQDNLFMVQDINP